MSAIDSQQDPRRVLLTRLMWIWFGVSAALLAVFATGEWLMPQIRLIGLPAWLTALLEYCVRFAFGFAAGFFMLALLMLQQRSALRK